MEVECIQTLKDLVAFNIYHQDRQPWWVRHKGWWVGSIGVAACSLFGGVLYILFLAPPDSYVAEGPGGRLFLAVPVVTFLVLWTACWLATRESQLARRVRQVARRPENKRMLGWHCCAITPKGVTVRTSDSSTSVAWTGVVKMALAGDYIYFYITRQSAIIVPRRPFATEEDFVAFAEMARRYWDTARKAPREENPPPRGPDTNITGDKRAGQ